jgi:tetratricopeptide (TPR) repeat protein
MAAPDLADSLLYRQGEEEWQRLRRHLELAEGFWLGYLFTPSPRTAAIFRERTERFLRSKVRTLRVLRPETPEKLKSLLPSLFDSGTAAAGGLWIEAIRSDSSARPSSSAGAWTLAWDELLLRLNERRERIRRLLKGGLVLAAPPDIKIRVREAAPDLWSIRSIVLEPSPIVSDRRVVRREIIDAVHPSMTRTVRVPDPQAALPLPDDLIAGAAALLRESEGLISLEEPWRAIEKAAAAVEMLQKADTEGGSLDLADGLAILARAEEADGDLAGAAEHLETAIRLRKASPSHEVMSWLDLLRDIALRTGQLPQALRASQEFVELSHRFAQERDDAPEALRSLALSLLGLGDVLKRDDFAAASSAYQQSLEITQRLREQFGDSPQVLRDLAITLGRLGDVQREIGDTAAAAAASRQSLDIAQQLREQLGDSPQVLRDLSISLERLGDTSKDTGDIAAALAAYQQSLEIAQQLREQLGDSLLTLRDLSVKLERLGDARNDVGDIAAASVAYQQSLDIARKLQEQFGDSPQILRDLAISFDRMGEMSRKAGALKQAEEFYRKALVLAQRQLDVYGGTPRTLTDLKYFQEQLESLAKQSRS